MDSIDIIIELLKQKGTTGAKMSRELGFSNAVFSQWKQRKQKPSVASMKKMADYFGVSIDTLLGDSDKASIREDIERSKKLIEEHKDFYEWLSKNQNEVDDMPIEKARLLFYFDALNGKGQVEAIRRTEELTQISKYQANNENE